MVSVIVPIYNCEEFLDRCVDSILTQEYTDFEAIFVDDGSTDHSLDVLAKYTDDKRVKIYSKPNAGAADARNFGLGKVSPKTEFVVFIDSDDSVEPLYLQTLVDGSQEYDCVVCNMRDIYGSREVIGAFTGGRDLICSNIFQNPEFLSLFHTGTLNSSCNKLYRLDTIREHNLRFDTERYNEDISFNVEYLTHCQAVNFVNKPLYNYHHRPGSVTSAPPKRAVADYVKLQKRLYSLIPAELHHYVDDFVSYQYFNFFLKFMEGGDDAAVKSFLKDEYVARSLKAHKSASLGEWLQYTIMSHSWLKLYRNIFFRFFKS